MTAQAEAFWDLLTELDRLRAEGADETTVDAHGDNMDDPWWALSEEDRDAIEVRLAQGVRPAADVGV